MARHPYWRIIALLLAVLIVLLIYKGLLDNSRRKLNEIFTANFSLTLTRLMSDLDRQVQVSGITAQDNQTILEDIQARYPDIRVLALVQGKNFYAHTDSSLAGKRITKDIFDAQVELRKNLVQADSEPAFVIWQSDAEQDVYKLYYPLRSGDELTGIAYLKIALQSEYPFKVSGFMILLLLIIFTVVMIVLDRYIARYNFIPAVLLFIIAIIIINSSLLLRMESVVNGWNGWHQEAAGEIKEIITGNGVYAEPEVTALELPLTSSLKTWSYTLSFLGLLFFLFIFSGGLEKFIETIIEHRLAYAYILPAMFGVFLLVFFPFIYGILIGFTDYNLTNFGGDLIQYFSNLKNYGFDNFYNILRIINFHDYSNFYYTLVHTIVWTISNLALHVSIGVGLALLLNDTRLKGRTIFRILLILPWAIPNYITALIWKGMFHKQFGAVNGFLEMLGFDSISWFTQPLTSFLANLATNVWLGFPFMMIIALGALQSIPKELYEASSIDGSTKWQSFWNVTVPLLRPAMVPAIILGTIWTFNQFNVIYLVSSGGPDGATELLITDAYKLAFEQYRYGYAAAYCIIIFVVLLTYGIVTSKVTKATTGAYE